MRKKRQSLLTIGLFLALLGVLFLGASPVTAVEKGTLRAAIHWAPSRDWVDPAISGFLVSGHFILYMFHDSLIKPMPGEMMSPCLAESWTHNDNFTVWDFKLRQGVKFHNGEEMTADDVVFTFQRYKGGMSTYIKKKIEKLEAVSRYHFRVTLNSPYVDFLDIFLPGASTIGWVVPKKYVEKVGDDGYKRNPIGAGPFKFVEFDPGQKIVGEAFDDFWRHKPKIRRLEVNIVKEPATRFAMVKRGEVDISTLMVDKFYKAVEDDPNLHIGHGISSSTIYVHYHQMYNPKSPWANKLVRRAASYALNRKLLADIHSPGTEPMGTLGLTGHPDTLPRSADRYDPKLAKFLLAEAGYPNGFDGGKFYPIDGPYWPMGEQVINDWNAVGIKVKGVFLERSAQRAARNEGKFADGISLDNAFHPQVSGRLANFFLPLYWHKGAWPEIDKMWGEYMGSLDLEFRMNRLMKIQALLYDNEIFTPTQQLSSPAGVGPRVKGNPWKIVSPYPVWIFSPMEDIELKD